MKDTDFWKTFNLNSELHIAANFIYSGLNVLDQIENIEHEDEVFEVFYNLSVGIERLLKIAYVLIEHDDLVDQNDFEKTLQKFQHNHVKLFEHLSGVRNIQLRTPQKALFHLLSDFYKKYRYSRYSLSSIKGKKSEIEVLKSILVKHFKLDFGHDEIPFVQYEMEPVRIAAGNVIKPICLELYRIIEQASFDSGIFTYEIRPGSKAYKLFMEQTYNFGFENHAIRELLAYLIKSDYRGKIDELLENFECLDFDSELVASFLDAFRSGLSRAELVEHVRAVYSGNEGVSERFELLKYLSSELSYCEFGEPELEEQGDFKMPSPSIDKKKLKSSLLDNACSGQLQL